MRNGNRIGIKIFAVCLAGMLFTGGIAAFAQEDKTQSTAKITVVAKNLNQPQGIAADPSGKLCLASPGDGVLYQLNGKTVSPFAGKQSPRDIYNQAYGGYADGTLSKAAFCQPTAMVAWEDALFVADTGNDMVRLIQNGKVSTYAGGRQAGYRDGTRKEARFHQPSGVAVDPQGNVYVSDTANQVIRKISPKGTVSTVAGTPKKAGFSDGAAASAQFSDPLGLAWNAGALYIADSGNQRIRVLKDGKVSTLAGGGELLYEGTAFYAGSCADGAAQEARFNQPCARAFDTDGTLYIADMDNGRVRMHQNGRVSTVIGGPGTAVEKYLAAPAGLLVKKDQLYITDYITGTVLTVQI